MLPVKRAISLQKKIARSVNGGHPTTATSTGRSNEKLLPINVISSFNDRSRSDRRRSRFLPAPFPRRDGATATRKPRLLFRLSGEFLLRFADRQLEALLFQPPPRFTRIEPYDRSPEDFLSHENANANSRHRPLA